jgi:hypothetical protein
MECIYLFIAQRAGFVFQQDGDAIADRVSEAGAAALQFVFRSVERERAFGDGADEEFEEFGIHGVITLRLWRWNGLATMITFRAGLW